MKVKLTFEENMEGLVNTIYIPPRYTARLQTNMLSLKKSIWDVTKIPGLMM